jgi:transcriptional regulator with XRE-family HTH domain
MIVGPELARSRRRLGLSLEELSKRTRLSIESLTAIEHGDIDRLPDMIHLRSCVSRFAHEVGLDPDSASTRYMAELTGRSPLDEFESEESMSFDSIDLARTRLPDEPTDAFPAETTLASFDADDSGDVEEGWKARTALLRLVAIRPPLSWGHAGYAALVAVTLITLSTGFWMSVARQKAARKPGVTVSAHLPEATTRPGPDSARRDDAVPEAGDNRHGSLGGSWMLTSEVENSSLRSFDDLTLGFRLQLAQQGNRVRGHGLKWIENGRPVASRARTPITVDGTIADGRLVLAFTERGIRRISHGTLNMQVADDGTLRGRFATDAARSSGRAQAVRLPSQPE